MDPKYETISRPSKRIGHFEDIIKNDQVSLRLTLITMKRSFLLAINPCVHFGAEDARISKEQFAKSYLDGLSLALGDLYTCIIDRGDESSVASCTLASRLSRSVNGNKPVYVSVNHSIPSENIENVYQKIFRFVKLHYSLVQQ